MMLLRSSPASPFGRKVRIAAAVLGLEGALEVVAADTTRPDDPLRSDNPLGKVPTLVAEDGTVLYDSAVILEYLDARAGGGKLLPASGPERFRVLTLQALADGIMEAALLVVYEGRYRPAERHEPGWLDLQRGKIARALARLDASPPPLARPPDAGAVALACALGYLDLRLGEGWREGSARLAAWLEAFAAAVPAFERTRAPG